MNWRNKAGVKIHQKKKTCGSHRRRKSFRIEIKYLKPFKTEQKSKKKTINKNNVDCDYKQYGKPENQIVYCCKKMVKLFLVNRVWLMSLLIVVSVYEYLMLVVSHIHKFSFLILTKCFSIEKDGFSTTFFSV